MTIPIARQPVDENDCVCGHDRHDHESLWPQCTRIRCECLMFHTTAPKTPPKVLAVSGLGGTAAVGAAQLAAPRKQVSDLNLDQLITQGKKSAYKRTATLAGKIGELVEDLRHRLVEESEAERERVLAERQREQARKEIADLEAKLAAAKEKLKGRRHELGMTGGERPGVVQCPDCEQQFDTRQRLGVHRRWQHGYRRGQS